MHVLNFMHSDYAPKTAGPGITPCRIRTSPGTFLYHHLLQSVWRGEVFFFVSVPTVKKRKCIDVSHHVLILFPPPPHIWITSKSSLDLNFPIWPGPRSLGGECRLKIVLCPSARSKLPQEFHHDIDHYFKGFFQLFQIFMYLFVNCKQALSNLSLFLDFQGYLLRN